MVSLDAFIEKLNRKVEIIVGFPKDKQVTYPPDDRKGRKGKGGQTVAQVARIQEFGKKGVYWNELNKGHGGRIDIPSRPFLRTTLKNNKKKIVELVTAYYTPKNIDNPKYLDAVAEQVRQMVVKSILFGKWKPNSPRTIGIKKSSQPLVDRGFLWRNVAAEVKIK